MALRFEVQWQAMGVSTVLLCLFLCKLQPAACIHLDIKIKNKKQAKPFHKLVRIWLQYSASLMDFRWALSQYSPYNVAHLPCYLCNFHCKFLVLCGCYTECPKQLILNCKVELASKNGLVGVSNKRECHKLIPKRFINFLHVYYRGAF